ncbi:MAG: Serine protease [Candidatus Alkanophagales archaeon MCA70_species_1]|nr:Serine protease [Candidatus Alkanophaga volatiphilum]
MVNTMHKLIKSAVFLLSLLILTSSAQAIDLANPDISVKILAPSEIMPNATYFIGIKYAVNETIWDEPALNPEINVNVENAEVISAIPGIFNVRTTSTTCNFSYEGRVEEGKSEFVVFVIKTQDKDVRIEVEAKAHDKDDEDIVSAEKSITIPIEDINPNSKEYFLSVSIQREKVFKQFLYLVNETLLTESEAEKISDEGMLTAIYLVTSACYELMLNEIIGKFGSGYLNPLTGIGTIYDYVDLTSNFINGFEGNPFYSFVSWAFEWCSYVVNKIILDMDILIAYGDYPYYDLKDYISLIEQEENCWRNGDFSELKSVFEQEKELASKIRDKSRRVSKYVYDDQSLPEDTREYVKILYEGLSKTAEADLNLIDEFTSTVLEEPKPSFVSYIPSKIRVGKNNTFNISFKIRNDGGTASIAYFDLSLSDGLNITSYSSDKPSGVFGLYKKGDLIWYRDEYQIPANYTLLDWYGFWFGKGDEITINVTITATQLGEQWIKYRLAFKPLLDDIPFIRVPSEGELDQQGWHAYKIIVNVSDIGNSPPTVNFSYTVSGFTVNFKAEAHDPDGDELSYHWDFGDGYTSTNKNPTHTYKSGGNYSVTLTVTDSGGLSGYKTKVIRINEPPKADFTYNVNGTTVSFISTSTDDGKIVSWEWDFGDGEKGYGETVRHEYSTFGEFSVKLTVTDNEGCKGEISKKIFVSIPLKIVIQDADVTWGTTSMTLDEKLKGQMKRVPRRVIVEAASKTFMNGLIGNSSLFNTTFKVPKRPIIEAVSAIFMTKLEENKNLISQTSRIPERITVESASVLYFTRLNVPSLNKMPIALFTFSPEKPFIGETIIFNASLSYDLDGYIVSYEWDFGDGNVTSTTHEIIKHSYSEVGNYEVTLTVKDDKGATNSTTKIITVMPAKPSVSISTDKYEYTAGDVMLINITITNPEGEWKGVKFLWTLDILDYDVHFTIINNRSLVLPPLYDKTFTLRWRLPELRASFNASWHIAIFNATTSELISEDHADWKYVARARETGDMEVEKSVRDGSAPIFKVIARLSLREINH